MDTKIEKLIEKGDAALENGNIEKAIAEYTKAIVFNQNNADALSARAWAYFWNEDYDEALRDSNKVLKLDSDEADDFYLRGEIFRVLEKYDKAILDYSEAIRRDPEDARYYTSRGIAYDRGIGLYLKPYNAKKVDDYFNKAILDFNKAILIEPDNGFIYHMRAYTYGHMLRKNLAISDYKKAISLYDPKEDKAKIKDAREKIRLTKEHKFK